MKAFVHLNSFDGRSTFSTWLTRIAINTALMTLRRKRARPETSMEWTTDGNTWRQWEVADMEQHKVRIRISEALPSVPMDGELVGRVLRHLLENAVGYSPPGSTIEISGKIEGDRLVVIVADEGPGVHEADVPFIFEKAFRGRNQRMHTQGTGMGLAITRAILDAYGGGINVLNSPGHGIIFTFWIPARQ